MQCLVLDIVSCCISYTLLLRALGSGGPDRPPSETLLPNTAGFFAISNVDTLSERQVNPTRPSDGRSVMEPFTRTSGEFESDGRASERLGLALEDMKESPAETWQSI